jgi:pimeloyl-ACP methyl ester carboxylesterase
MREGLGEDFYIVWFQERGPADEALARDVRRTFTTTRQWTKEWAAGDDDPPRPDWMSEEDLRVYVETFERTGFTGGLNWYRNLNRNWELREPYADRRIEQPALYMAGSRDPVLQFMPPQLMDGWVTDLRGSVTIEGGGHWIQQERADEVNEALLRFVREAY